jgi:hypothetical protein
MVLRLRWPLLPGLVPAPNRLPCLPVSWIATECSHDETLTIMWRSGLSGFLTEKSSHLVRI